MIETTDTALDALWKLYHAPRRSTVRTIVVPLDAFEALLRDHHTLITALQSRKLLQVTVGEDQGSLCPGCDKLAGTL